VVLDNDGWVNINDLLEKVIARHSKFCGANQQTLESIIKNSDKQRFEINGDRIRAVYGHSIESKIQHENTQPPQQLFHGTPVATAEIILKEGLKPMNRQYVHMSSELKTAEIVARRWHKDFVILIVEAQSAFDNGVCFYTGNDDVWLADHVPAQFIRKPS